MIKMEIEVTKRELEEKLKTIEKEVIVTKKKVMAIQLKVSEEVTTSRNSHYFQDCKLDNYA